MTAAIKTLAAAWKMVTTLAWKLLTLMFSFRKKSSIVLPESKGFGAGQVSLLVSFSVYSVRVLLASVDLTISHGRKSRIGRRMQRQKRKKKGRRGVIRRLVNASSAFLL